MNEITDFVAKGWKEELGLKCQAGKYEIFGFGECPKPATASGYIDDEKGYFCEGHNEALYEKTIDLI